LPLLSKSNPLALGFDLVLAGREITASPGGLHFAAWLPLRENEVGTSPPHKGEEKIPF